MKRVTYHHIFRYIVDNKRIVNNISNQLFSESINPCFLNNNSKKLRVKFFRKVDGGVGFRINNSNGRELFELLHSIRNHLLINDDSDELVDCVSVLSIAWYFFNDLDKIVKFFHLKDLKISFVDDRWLLGSWQRIGIIPKGIYMISYHSGGRLGFYNPNQSCSYFGKVNEMNSCRDLMDIGGKSVSDFLNPGMMIYLGRNMEKEFSIPHRVRNNIDFLVWKKAVSSIRITSINITRLLYVVRGGSDLSKQETFVRVRMWGVVFSRVGNTKYFRELFSGEFFRMVFGYWWGVGGNVKYDNDFVNFIEDDKLLVYIIEYHGSSSSKIKYVAGVILEFDFSKSSSMVIDVINRWWMENDYHLKTFVAF